MNADYVKSMKKVYFSQVYKKRPAAEAGKTDAAVNVQKQRLISRIFLLFFCYGRKKCSLFAAGCFRG